MNAGIQQFKVLKLKQVKLPKTSRKSTLIRIQECLNVEFMDDAKIKKTVVFSPGSVINPDNKIISLVFLV